MSEMMMCPACSEPMLVSLRFCGSCGESLGEVPPAAREDVADAEGADSLPALQGDLDAPADAASSGPSRIPFEMLGDAPITHVAGPQVLDEQVRGVRRRWLWPASIAAGVVVCTIAVGLVAQATTMSTLAASAPATQTPSVREFAGLPGWASSAVWSDDAPSKAVVVAAGGKRFATSTDTTITIRDDSGARVTQEQVKAAPNLLSGSVDAAPALLAVAGAQLLVWTGDMTSAAVWELPAGARVAVLGAGVVVSGADGQVFVVTGDGLAPFTTPRPGAAPLALTADGALQWASARGEVLTASGAGTLVQQIAMAAPVAGASVSRWLAGGQTIVLVWALPDGSTTLATHSATDGTVLASTPIDATTAQARLVASPGPATAMIGTWRIDLATGWVGNPVKGFTASTALGEAFYGATGARAGVLTGDTVVAAEQTPTITPLGVTANGALIALAQGIVTIFPKAPAN